MPRDLLSIGQLASLVGRSRETIRRYEALGLIPLAHRAPVNGRRFWTAQAAAEIRERLRPTVGLHRRSIAGSESGAAG